MAKILAVDDEPAILEMIESILNKDGHLVTKVSNPLKINMEELHRYDLILLDIMMPGMDGFELCKRIRALVDCPILFLTAKTEENSLVNGLSLGADDYISKQMQPVLDAIGQIKDQNLEYETSCSGIKEFDDCLSAIDDMRDALRESLEKQWKTEQEKKQQMSALAHDIKTPLTIVRGNAELLSETELTTEQKNNITYVLNGTTQIQSYVKQLIDVTKSWNCSDVTYTTVRLEDFFADIKEQALGLVEIYHQKIDWKAGQSDKKVTIAYDPMFRAVMNMIQNAVEHTKENGIIYIDAKEQDGRLTFIVEDSGSGFTKEALLHGTEQFFMDDTSRNGEAHYGMGLFFAKTVAEKYGGGIKLSNSENTGGARVEIFFLSSQETS